MIFIAGFDGVLKSIIYIDTEDLKKSQEVDNLGLVCKTKTSPLGRGCVIGKKKRPFPSQVSLHSGLPEVL